MQSNYIFGARRLIKMAVVASLIGAAWAPSAFAAPAVDSPDSAQAPSMVQAQAIQSWHEDMVRTSAPADGCFQASFPSILWKQVTCSEVKPFSHPLPRHKDALTRLSETSTSGGTQTTGNGNDYAIEVAGSSAPPPEPFPL